MFETEPVTQVIEIKNVSTLSHHIISSLIRVGLRVSMTRHTVPLEIESQE